MKIINKYLEEFGVAEVFIVVTIKMIIIQTLFLFISYKMMKDMLKNMKTDNNLSKKVNQIIKGNYKVQILPDNELNAFTFAFPWEKNLYLYKGCFKRLTEKEIIAVLLHEVGHTKQHFYYVNSIITRSAFYSALFALFAVIIPQFFAIFVIWSLIIQKPNPQDFISRLYEYNADSYAAKLGYGEHLKSALIKLAKHYKENMNKPKTLLQKLCNYLKELFDTHPETYKRLENITKKSKEMKESIKKGFLSFYNFMMKELLPSNIKFPSVKEALKIVRKLIGADVLSKKV